MKKIASWMKRTDNVLAAGICAMALAVGAFLWAYSSIHNAQCEGCNWFWCHLYTGGGSI